MKLLYINIIWLLVFFGLVFPVMAEITDNPIAFKNIIIDTLGDQDYDPDQNIITSKKHVRITIDDIIIESDKLTYYGNQNQLVANGNIRIMKDKITLSADQLTFFGNTGWLEAFGDVQFISSFENYRSDLIRYNLKLMTGNMGPLQGVVQGGQNIFYLTGKEAQFNKGTTVISSAKLTRSPWKNNPDYVFTSQKMVLQGEGIYMEKVFLKILGAPVLYLPKMVLQGAAAPRINLSANQGEDTDLSQMVDKNKELTTAPKSKTVNVSPRFQLLINPFDKPSIVTVGRIYFWDLYSHELDLNFDSRGIFSFSDIYQIDWEKYNLTIDGKTDLIDYPQQEFGMAFTKKAWKTDYGNWQVGLVTRWLYNDRGIQIEDGIYGGYRLNYQYNPDLNVSYLYLTDLTGSNQDWEHLEHDFLVINNYRLGGNFIYSLNIPLYPHYFLINKGYYSFQKDDWTSQILLLAREVGRVKAGLGWDFAKNFIELTFKLNFN